MTSVTELIVHPEWNFQSESYDADVAIAVLARTIPFNKFVRPICLWTETNSYEDLIGQQGVIAGWGKTEMSVVSTAEPRWAKLKVVDTITCVRSGDDFYKLISERTFCAGGGRNNKIGPCNGDSGKFSIWLRIK